MVYGASENNIFALFLYLVSSASDKENFFGSSKGVVLYLEATFGQRGF